MSGQALALIVARPGLLREGLLALVTAISRGQVVDEIGNVLGVVEVASEHCLDLVLFDASLSSEEIWPVLQRVKSQSPQTRCVVLADNDQQCQEAKQASADAVLLKGTSAAKIAETIEQLLFERANFLSAVSS
jgi:DNA-binding NarL/FixJ family response regulator